MKIAIIFHRYGPYHITRLASAAKQMEVVAIELSSQTSEYDWKKPSVPNHILHITAFKNENSRTVNIAKLSTRLNNIMSDVNPDIVAINGWSDRSAILLLQWCNNNGVPAIAMSESTLWDFQRVKWKERLKKVLVSRFSGAIVGGKAHQAYLQGLGMPEQYIEKGYDVIDNTYFASAVREIRKKTAFYQQQYNLPEEYFLASNRFIPKKNLLRLIEAYEHYADQTDSPFHLVLLGDGPLRPQIESLVKQSHWKEKIHLPGFRQIEELPVYYALAKAFVHASTSEQWGLVVNEAMACHLPVIVSNKCGCANELVQNGKNGWQFEPINSFELAGYMKKITEDPSLRQKMGKASARIIDKYNPEIFGTGLKKLAKKIISDPRKLKNGYFSSLLIELIKRLYKSPTS